MFTLEVVSCDLATFTSITSIGDKAYGIGDSTISEIFDEPVMD